MSKYIKPPSAKDCTWRSGPPPSVGWWPADYEPRNPANIRWWNGSRWSSFAEPVETSEAAADAAREKLNQQTSYKVRWTDRWWEPAAHQPTKEPSKP